jgi:hypothetical protein
VREHRGARGRLVKGEREWRRMRLKKNIGKRDLARKVRSLAGNNGTKRRF